MMNLQEKFEIKESVKKAFKNSQGEPFLLTDGQAELFAMIYKKKHPRNHIETHTRYGKSDVISMAVLLRAANFPEKWAIVAGKKDKAAIIMGYIIGHVFDNEYFRTRFVIGRSESEENIRRYRNKDRINFDLGEKKLGEIYICSAQDAMGWGAPNVVEDESALVSDQDHALVMRMLGDQPENFLCKVGNPWESGHFRASFEDPAYHKLIIDYRQGIREGRLTPEYVDEMRKQPFFNVLYECNFPKQGTTDEKGWIPLLTIDQVKNALVEECTGFGINKLGVDVAGGGRNFSVIVKRFTNVAKIVHKTQDSDTMNLVEEVINKKMADGIWPEDVFVDKVGIGRGAYDILNRTKETAGVWGINGANKPTTPQEAERFINLRAELFWKLREWILGGGKLLGEGDLETSDWLELAKIKYKTKLEGAKGKMIIMSKEQMLREGIQSPDVADALAMTFRGSDIPRLDPEEEEELERRQEQEGGFNPFDPFS